MKRSAPERVPTLIGLANQSLGLTLGELEAGAGAAETVLLTLFLTSIAGQETGGLENGAKFRVDFAECAGDAVAQASA